MAELERENELYCQITLPFSIVHRNVHVWTYKGLLPVWEDLHVEADVNSRLCYMYNLLFTLHNVCNSLQCYIIYFK